MEYGDTQTTYPQTSQSLVLLGKTVTMAPAALPLKDGSVVKATVDASAPILATWILVKR